MKTVTRSFYVRAVERTIADLVADLDRAVRLSDLAERSGLSPFHFHRVFRGMVGETPLELTRRLRLERAAWQLVTTTRPIVDVALGAGFETHEAFSRAFRDSYGTSPSGFRDAKMRRVELAASSGVHYGPQGGSPTFVPRDSGGSTMTVTLVTQPRLRVAGVRHRGPYNQIGEAFGRLHAIAEAAGWLTLAGIALVGIYHDDPESVAPDDLRSDAGLVLPTDVALPETVIEQALEAGRYARTEHRGPYEGLGDTWARFLGEWLPESGCRIRAGLSYERYQNTPMDTAPADLRTDLYVPLV